MLLALESLASSSLMAINTVETQQLRDKLAIQRRVYGKHHEAVLFVSQPARHMLR